MSLTLSLRLGLLLLICAGGLLAQNGQLVITGGSTANPYPTTAAVVVPTAVPDACTSISTAVALLPADGGTVDARNLTGTLNCQNPMTVFAGKANILLLLGAITITLPKTWTLPSNVTVKGIGATSGAGASNLPATTIKSYKSLSGPVIALGDGTSPGNIVMRDLTVDCNGSNATGIQSTNSGDGVALERIKITNCGDTGLSIQGAGDTGTYRDIYVAPGSAGNIGTTCVRVSVAGTWRGIYGLTCDMSKSTAAPGYGIYISGQGGELSDVHVERSVVGVLIDGLTQGLVARNIHGCATGQCSPFLQTLVMINSGSPSASLSGLQLEGTNAQYIIDDESTNNAQGQPNKIQASSVALYVVNGGSAACNTAQSPSTAGCQ